LPGETFSSWFSRTARSNGLTPNELYGVATNGAQIHSRDLDRLADRPLLVRLSAATGISADRLPPPHRHLRFEPTTICPGGFRDASALGSRHN
jgi:hypothetical protein